MHDALEETIGYSFKDKSILQRALTHASKSSQHLERQEFLGDAVLGLTIASYLFKQFPDLAEGDLSKMRANLVCKSTLLQIARAWDLAGFLEVGDGERSPRGELKSQSIAANAVESVIGAVFQDSNWDEARSVVLKAWSAQLKAVNPDNLRDAKSKLQELTQGLALGLPSYAVEDLGLNKPQRFQAKCFVQGNCLGTGKGARKKEAELNAAAAALKSKPLLLLIQGQ